MPDVAVAVIFPAGDGDEMDARQRSDTDQRHVLQDRRPSRGYRLRVPRSGREPGRTRSLLRGLITRQDLHTQRSVGDGCSYFFPAEVVLT